MRLARFTDSIASVDGWSYGAGTEVLVAGDKYETDAVPEDVGGKWFASGLLVEVESKVETARSLDTTPATNPRPHSGRVPRR